MNGRYFKFFAFSFPLTSIVGTKLSVSLTDQSIHNDAFIPNNKYPVSHITSILVTKICEVYNSGCLTIVQFCL